MTLTFSFEELPLINEGGVLAVLVDGRATISFYDDGEWFVSEIFLEAYRDHKRTSFQVDRNNKFWTEIWGELTDGSFKDSINEAVAEALAEDGIVPRSEYEDHSTLCRAMQGV